MSARGNGPYVLRDEPTQLFWRATDCRSRWTPRAADATEYPTRVDAERGRAAMRNGVGRAGVARVQIVAVADLPPPQFRETESPSTQGAQPCAA